MGKVYSVLFTLLFTIGLTGVTPVQLAGQDAMEQTINYDVRGEPLDLVLDRLARDTGIDLVYDPDIVRGITIFNRAEEEELAAFLAEILSAHNLDYLTLSTGTIVIIKKAGEDPSYGSFSGLIVDLQSGEPLPGATVMLADASGGTSTGSSGRFSLNRLMSGEHTIIFSYVGYEPVTRTVRIPSGGQTREVIELRPKPVDVAPVVVEAHKPRFY
ncbi:MAG: carboxypeptidase-like regulatory domain-containing protein, partial [Balneolaceae bacterium]